MFIALFILILSLQEGKEKNLNKELTRNFGEKKRI